MTLLCLGTLLFSFAYLAYTWVAYRLILARAAARRSHAPLFTPAAQPVPPVVHVLIAAHNEATVIGARIANLASLHYPATRLRIHIGADGCTDDTVACARTAAAACPLDIQIHAFPVNRGKVAVLKELLTAAAPADDELLVLTDANTHFDSSALERLISHFADPHIGGVCGRLVLGTPGERSPEAGYWGLETELKIAESTLDSCLGANGAIYAIRSNLFWRAIPDNTIVDDFVLGMKVREAGFRMIYEPRAVAYEELPHPGSEWGRRVRIGAGDYQALGLCRHCLAPRFRWFAWCFLSHKVLRWFTPHVLVLAAVAALLLPTAVDHLSLPAMLPLLGVLATLAAGVFASSPRGRQNRLCCGISHFLAMNAGLLCGFWRWSRGELTGTWIRTPRQSTQTTPDTPD